METFYNIFKIIILLLEANNNTYLKKNKIFRKFLKFFEKLSKNK